MTDGGEDPGTSDDGRQAGTGFGAEHLVPFLGMVVMAILVLTALNSPGLIISIAAAGCAAYAIATKDRHPVLKGLAVLLAPLAIELGLETSSKGDASAPLTVALLFVAVPIGVVMMMRRPTPQEPEQ